ncbi:hypothetical protein JK358_16800 [Nocardia sp. 2]|uniref:DUF732 domain-containing protein n=1 Tax=Nocardia acididurans TaxID=2802282 RepID=A0ABS1M8I4_9NOCA|nr:hypothetical protein [Nocardia acididurans]MBL1076059.1 hypothetical protein [Nocardia acididurans]
MSRSAVAVAVTLGVVMLGGCSTESPSGTGAPATTTSTGSTSVTASGELPGGLPSGPTALRAKTCTDWAEFFTQATVTAPQLDPNWTPAIAVKGIVKEMGESPEFTSLSPAQQAAIVAGVEDAATGNCPS